MADYIYKGRLTRSKESNDSTQSITPKNNSCKICNDTKEQYQIWAVCNSCHYWFHPQCLNYHKLDYSDDESFHCITCQELVDNNQLYESPSCSQATNSKDSATHSACNETDFLGIDISQCSNISSELGGDGHFHMGGYRSPTPSERPSSRSSNTNSSRDASSKENHTQAIPEILEDDESCLSTDDEGNAEILAIHDFKTSSSGRRFLVEYRSNGSKEWLHEKHLDGCVDLLARFLEKNNLEPTKLKHKQKVGSSQPSNASQANWVYVEDAVRAANTYGLQGGLSVTGFKKLDDRDSITLLQVGAHCYVILYYARTKHCFVADGENTFINNTASRKLVFARLSGARTISFIRFYGQKEKNYCGSSAAGIATEFQRLYKSGEKFNSIQVPDTTMRRIKKALHKYPDEKINRWQPINKQSWKTQCEKCGKKFNTKNRGAMNLHKC